MKGSVKDLAREISGCGLASGMIGSALLVAHVLILTPYILVHPAHPWFSLLSLAAVIVLQNTLAVAVCGAGAWLGLKLFCPAPARPWAGPFFWTRLAALFLVFFPMAESWVLFHFFNWRVDAAVGAWAAAAALVIAVVAGGTASLLPRERPLFSRSWLPH